MLLEWTCDAESILISNFTKIDDLKKSQEITFLAQNFVTS